MRTPITCTSTRNCQPWLPAQPNARQEPHHNIEALISDLHTFSHEATPASQNEKGTNVAQYQPPKREMKMHLFAISPSTVHKVCELHGVSGMHSHSWAREDNATLIRKPTCHHRLRSQRHGLPHPGLQASLLCSLGIQEGIAHTLHIACLVYVKETSSEPHV